jgi:hypothetical protein
MKHCSQLMMCFARSAFRDKTNFTLFLLVFELRKEEIEKKMQEKKRSILHIAVGYSQE